MAEIHMGRQTDRQILTEPGSLAGQLGWGLAGLCVGLPGWCQSCWPAAVGCRRCFALLEREHGAFLPGHARAPANWLRLPLLSPAPQAVIKLLLLTWST